MPVQQSRSIPPPNPAAAGGSGRPSVGHLTTPKPPGAGKLEFKTTKTVRPPITEEHPAAPLPPPAVIQQARKGTPSESESNEDSEPEVELKYPPKSEKHITWDTGSETLSLEERVAENAKKPWLRRYCANQDINSHPDPAGWPLGPREAINYARGGSFWPDFWPSIMLVRMNSLPEVILSLLRLSLHADHASRESGGASPPSPAGSLALGASI